ncbi:MAG: Ig-like domain-containing protein [Gemmatimonadales bacterium]|nr:Ig-like domain-containing protein [Gemmatimonadales bacterium]
MAPLRVLSWFQLLPPLLACWACGGDDLGLPSDTGTQLEVVQGNGQRGPTDSRLADPLIVQLVDESGDGVSGRAVVWVVSSGGGTVDPATSTTDAEGFASAEWTLGQSAGPNTVAAQVPGVGSVTFTAMGTDDDGGGASGARSTISAEPSTIEVGSGSSTITVTVRDGAGGPVEGAAVVLQASGDGNTLTQPSAVTGSDGIATGAIRSAVPGEKVISATVDGSVELAQTALVTVSSGPVPTDVDRLVFLVPPADVEEGETFPVEVALVDQDGNVVPLSEIFIYVALFPEGQDTPVNGVLRGERFENTVNGVAVLSLAVEQKGRYRLRALTDDLPELGPYGPEPHLYSDVFEVD